MSSIQVGNYQICFSLQNRYLPIRYPGRFFTTVKLTDKYQRTYTLQWSGSMYFESICRYFCSVVCYLISTNCPPTYFANLVERSNPAQIQVLVTSWHMVDRRLVFNLPSALSKPRSWLSQLLLFFLELCLEKIFPIQFFFKCNLNSNEISSYKDLKFENKIVES